MSMSQKKNSFTVNHYTNPIIFKNTTNMLINNLIHINQKIIVICIGTDRSTGDSLGPQTGTYLSKLKPKHLTILGTLHNPVHALNLEETIKRTNNLTNKPFIIAVDAALGKMSSVGNITCSATPLRPGAAFNKKLPQIGDISLTGVVNCTSLLDYTTLQSTRLSLVYDMARVLSNILYQVDLQLDYDAECLYKDNHATWLS